MKNFLLICIFSLVFSACSSNEIENIYINEDSKELQRGIINDEYNTSGVYPKQFEDICTGKIELTCENYWGYLCGTKLRCNSENNGITFYKNSTKIIELLNEKQYSRIEDILNGKTEINIQEFWVSSLFSLFTKVSSQVLYAKKLDDGLIILSCSGDSGSCNYQLGYFYMKNGEIKYPIIFLEGAEKIDIIAKNIGRTPDDTYFKVCGKDLFDCPPYGKKVDDYFISWFQSLPASKLKEYVYGIKK